MAHVTDVQRSVDLYKQFRAQSSQCLGLSCAQSSQSRWRHPERSRFSGVARDLAEVCAIPAYFRCCYNPCR
jgi:hypothetical protein